MDSTEIKQTQCFEAIDFSRLMDLRVDFAFKLLFTSGESMYLVSLLNAIFANKKIWRKINSITILNPALERRSKDDKLSTLDIRAQLDDGTTILIEMHLYDLFDLKYKTIRSWARAYGEELQSGEKYSAQPPVVCVAFVNGQVVDSINPKIHLCFKIMDINDHTVLTDALELHYIDMKAYVGAVNRTRAAGDGKVLETKLAKWLAVITEKDVVDKAVIRDSCVEQEEIGMAVSALARLSEDKIARQEYLKRQDEIMLYNMKLGDLKHSLEQEKLKRAQERIEFEQEKKKAEQEKRRAEVAEAEIVQLREKLAQLETQVK